MLSNAFKRSHTLPICFPNASICFPYASICFPYASIRYPYAFNMLLICFCNAFISFYMLIRALEAKVSPQEQQQARWSLVYRLLPAEAGKKYYLANILLEANIRVEYGEKNLTHFFKSEDVINTFCI